MTATLRPSREIRSGAKPAEHLGASRRFEPYPAYKDSGVEWLGEIPAHWRLKRLKYFSSINDEALGEDTDPDLEVSYVDIGSVDAIEGIVEKERFVFANAPSRARRVVRHGDIIVSTVRTYLRAIAPIIDPEPGLIVSTGFAVVRPGRELDSSFASYALQAPYFVDRVVANSVGVSYPAINASEMARFAVATPDVGEQRAIAAFLDRETEKIDTLVAKKERLIELLEEKRTALITRAVTKGLDPNAPMKDAGVEWLDDIPAHWEVVKLKYLCSVVKDGLHLTPPKVEQGIPFLSTQHIRNRRIDLDTATFISEEDYRRGHPKVRPEAGDVLITLVGSIGFAAILRSKHVPLSFTRHVGYVRPRKDLLAKYLVNYTESDPFKTFIDLEVSQVAQPSIYLSSLAEHRIPAAPQSEQKQILAILSEETGKLDRLIAKIREGIDRLREFRTALISAAVTGKIDVREEAA